MDFEFDPAKSVSNKDKHGLDFIEAQALWLDEKRIEGPARSHDEDRSVLVGEIDGKHWTAVYTMRGSVVRLISVRRARGYEVENYLGR
jgi:uncharacterized protein